MQSLHLQVTKIQVAMEGQTHVEVLVLHRVEPFLHQRSHLCCSQLLISFSAQVLKWSGYELEINTIYTTCLHISQQQLKLVRVDGQHFAIGHLYFNFRLDSNRCRCRHVKQQCCDSESAAHVHSAHSLSLPTRNDKSNGVAICWRGHNGNEGKLQWRERESA